MEPPLPQSARRDACATVLFRIMATTDLHMHLLGFDYFTGRRSPRIGLARLASLIESQRRTRANCLLLDNGDMLQGSAMGDYLAEIPPETWHGEHAAIMAMNLMGYDAATLGNHDFSFGLPFLKRALDGARFPVVSTNLTASRSLGIARHLLLHRRVVDTRGASREVSIGILGFLPPQTVAWQPELRAEIAISDILVAAREGIATLTSQGADLIIALAHSGIAEREPAPMMENAATALAALPGIDAIIAGHTHRVFPAPDHPSGPGIDSKAGTLAGKPAVMPGFWGSHLGVVDLEIHRPPGSERWKVVQHDSRALPVDDLDEHEAVVAALSPAHHRTLRHFRRHVGRARIPLASHFTLIGHDSALRLVAMAQRWQVRKALRGTAWQDLPILSAAAPFRAGGRGGPDHYTDVADGRLTMRNLADLYLFPNHLRAILINGAGVRDWLERSASQFLQITPGAQDAPLIDPDFPSYNFDLIDGLNWQIDLSRPPSYRTDGRRNVLDSGRITELRHDGAPVRDDQQFILATNSYRLADSGFFAATAAGRPVLVDGCQRMRDVLRRYVSHHRVVAPDGDLGWRFKPMPETTVVFHTGPGAKSHLDRLRLRIDCLGTGVDGFLAMRLHL
ncbi:bifunctional 2',3'-cyclic-nucleotide 2'-phosphodiesterase/3'-nucleotidase [Paracoccus aurantius]